MLARSAGYSNMEATRLAQQLEKVLWTMPLGCSGIEVRHHGGRVHSTKLLDPEDDLQEVIVVSPFLDATTLGKIGSWGTEKTNRMLVSTRVAFREIASRQRSVLARFASVLQLGVPDLESNETASKDRAGDLTAPPSAEQTEESAGMPLDDGEFTPYRRLHAKLIAMAYGHGGHTLWMGSANATGRGWTGANVELMARMEVNATVWQGLKQWIASAALVDLMSLDCESLEEDPQRMLEVERSKLAARWDATLHFEIDRTRLVTKSLDPTPEDASTVLRVGLFTQDAMHCWKRGTREVEFEAAAPSARTAFVRVSLTSATGESLQWLQCCATIPTLDEERDYAAIGEYIGVRGAMAWWKAILRNVRFDGDEEPWDSVSPDRATNREELDEDNLTLEDMLSGWSRSPSEFTHNGESIERYLRYLAPVQAQAPEVIRLAETLKIWKMLKGGRH